MTYRLAVATHDGVHIDRHFGHSEAFVIYAVGADGRICCEGRREVMPPCGHGVHETAALEAVAARLADCRYVLAEAVGRGAQQALARHHVGVLEIGAGEAVIETAIGEIIDYDRRRSRVRTQRAAQLAGWPRAGEE
ncbi:MAG: NifB/NifX family molybdenum-iron cluster-binding protein [Selenomonadaceae bacterium]|jgi:predicted Fe-Mo cluster-binding NifX family protein|nr:hypothetical protein [Selenomonas sp.]MDY6272974.1 NifB/NifX family molybdenum-iron cluster-binding protein [Selenomonadaceae bacterium]MDY6298441.1 NifB/NifX family molybdenum-iron cluster-binding protein [Selenomonadaceae bacterium]